MSSEIRRDIWSVKHWDSAIPDWCHGFMTSDRNGAVRRADAIRRGIWYGHQTTRCKIVHPAQWVVNGYVAAGNEIESN